MREREHREGELASAAVRCPSDAAGILQAGPTTLSRGLLMTAMREVRPPGPKLNMPAWVFCLSWCSDLAFRVTRVFRVIPNQHISVGGLHELVC